MSPERRQVRATLDFFRDLDRRFPSGRGPNGEPSTGDFQTFELLNIVDSFAERFDEMRLLVSRRLDYRVLISAGRLVPAYAVVGQEAADGAIELVSRHIDTGEEPTDG